MSRGMQQATIKTQMIADKDVWSRELSKDQGEWSMWAVHDTQGLFTSDSSSWNTEAKAWKL